MARLLNLGSLCIDLVYGVPALAGAGETIASTERQVFAGGKGLNQSLAGALAGASVMHFGAVGEDGDMLLDILRSQDVDVTGVLRLPGPSGHAVIQVDNAGQNAIVISGGSNRNLPGSLLDTMLGALEAGDWVLLQNETNDVGTAMRAAADAGAKVAFNLAPPDERIHDYPIDALSLLIANEPEACALARTAESAQAFDALIDRYPDVSIVMTRGKDGLCFYDAASQTRQQMGAYSVQPVDETAAGDAFVGYLMAGLVSGASISDALPKASAAGALAVTREGAAPSIPNAAAVADMLARATLSAPLSEL